MGSKKVRRLFAGFAPKHYKIYLDPDRDNMLLTGSVTVTGRKTGRPSQRLTFHQNGLKIEKATLVKRDKKGQREIAVSRINHHKTLDEVRLHTDELLYPGQYEVRMEFAGEITRPMDGIYPCFFKHDGKDKILMATQFESHHARSAFPCIDEPEAKAAFDLTVVSPKGETVIGNTPVKKQSGKDGKWVTAFETTPVMSTYLLAFVFGELSYQEAKTKRGTLIRAYATPDNVRHTQFALDTAVKCLEFYEEYFDIPYPLAKCDLVALPDFASGAMENWGLITFREQALLVDPGNTSLPGKQRVAEVVCHELTHQWFGNLVTMRWWTDLWLNEGFATWMAYLGMDHLFPEWEIWTQFIAEEQNYALKLDALENTHPIVVPINHPDEIRTIFDAISYEKGGSSIHMLSQYLGHEMFRDGLRHYLKKHAYSNTGTADLWEALEYVSGKPVKKFMTAWTNQAGFPLLRAHIGESELHLTQEQFLQNPAARKSLAESKNQTLWPIALRANTGLPALFKQEEATHKFESPAEPLLLNRNHSGFYRTIYNASHIVQLHSTVKSGRLGHLDRGGLLADAFEAAKAGYAGTADALKLLEAFRDEDNDSVWDIIAANIAAIRNLMDDDELREALKPYVRKLVAKQLARLGWDAAKDESHFDTLLRPTVLAMASAADEPAVLREAQKRFADIEKKHDIAPDIRGIVYVSVARHGDAATFDRLLKMHNDSASSEERLKLAAALTDFKQPELTKRALGLITTDAVRLQDAMYWVAYSFANRFARRAAWDWMVENWAWLDQNLGTDLGFYRLPIYAARAISDPGFLSHYRKFFETVDKPGLDRSIKQGVEMIEWQSAWKARDLETIKAFLKQQ